MHVVTGAAGFIGSHLVRSLAATGAFVAAIDRRTAMPAEADMRLTADLADPDATAVDDVLRGAAVVFHLAGCPGVRGTGADLQGRRHRDNVVAGARVLERTPLQTPVVVASSASVYGGALDGGVVRPSRETDRLRPRGGYARSKAALERACAERAARGGSVAVARPFTVVGEGQRPDMAVSVWLAALERGMPLQILGSPSRTRDVTDVDDVVRGLRLMAERDVQATVNLGTGVGRTLADIATAVCAARGATGTLVVTEAAPEEAPVTLADTRRCRRLLGFTPSTDLAGVLRRQVAAATADRQLLGTT